jgi:hypothetical protein
MRSADHKGKTTPKSVLFAVQSDEQQRSNPYAEPYADYFDVMTYSVDSDQQADLYQADTDCNSFQCSQPQNGGDHNGIIGGIIGESMQPSGTYRIKVSAKSECNNHSTS